MEGDGSLGLWCPLKRGEKDQTGVTRLAGGGSNVYAAGKKGELYRWSNEGAGWRQVPLGMKAQVVLMTGKGDTVLAIMAGRRGGGVVCVEGGGVGMVSRIC